MGAYLSTPSREKVSEDNSTDILSYGASAMQGWRISQEDAHNCCPDFDVEPKAHLFAVYDGHGGAEVAAYTALHFPTFLKTMEAYTAGKMGQALEDAFLEFDATLLKEEVLVELKELAGVTVDDRDKEEEAEERDMLCEEAEMPIEELMARYGGAPAQGKSIKDIKKKATVLSPVIRPKKDDGKESVDTKSDENIKMKLEDKLVNGHSAEAGENGFDKVTPVNNNNKAEQKADNEIITDSKAVIEKKTDIKNKENSSDVIGQSETDKVVKDDDDDVKPVIGGAATVVDSSTVNGPVKQSPGGATTDVSSTTTNAAIKPETAAESSEAEAVSSSTDIKKAEQNSVAGDSGFSSSSGSSSAVAVSSQSSGGSSGGSSQAEASAGGSSSSSAGGSSGSSGAGGSSLSAVCTEAGGSSAGGSSSMSGGSSSGAGGSSQEAEAGSSSGKVRTKRKNIIPEDDEDESSYSGGSSGESGDEGEWVSDDGTPDSDDDLEDGMVLEDDEEDDDGEEEGELMTGGEEPGSDSGCTAVVALLRGRELYVANAGDSRCILCHGGKAVDMSIDHKPEDDLEHARINNAGGTVTADGRVNGGLNLSRAIGDHCYKQNVAMSAEEQMITALPDVKSVVLTEEDTFMVLACDGIWNVMSSQDVVNFVQDRIQSGVEKLSSICDEMFDFCLAPDTTGDGTGCDNMTCVIVDLRKLTASQPGSAKRPSTEESTTETEPKRQKSCD